MTIDEAIQILGLYDLGNTFFDIDGNPISPEKMASACDMAVEALNLKNRILERKSYLYYKDDPTEAEKADNTIICPNCGIEQYSDKDYCMDCGARLEESE